MKKAFKFLGILFGSLIVIFIIAAIVDISNDVEYEVIREVDKPNLMFLDITTEVTDNESFDTIIDDIKNEYKGKSNVVGLRIYDKPDGEILKHVLIPVGEENWDKDYQDVTDIK